MSTNATIAFQNDDLSVDVIYSHWDGYIVNGVGETLKHHYTSPDKIKELIALGSISVLGSRVHPSYSNIPEQFRKTIGHSFENPEQDVTIAYHRDRGDDLIIDHFESLEDYYKNNDWQEYNYLWCEHDDPTDQENRIEFWMVAKCVDSDGFGFGSLYIL